MNRIASARESARFSRIDRACSRSRLIADMPTEIRRYERESAKWHVLACIEALTADPTISVNRFNRFDSALCVEIARGCRRSGQRRLCRYWARLAVAARLIAADRS